MTKKIARLPAPNPPRTAIPEKRSLWKSAAVIGGIALAILGTAFMSLSGSTITPSSSREIGRASSELIPITPISRSSIPPSSCPINHTLALPLSAESTENLLLSYYEGDPLCLRIDQTNAKEAIEMLEEYAESGAWEELQAEGSHTIHPKALLKRCAEVQEGRRKPFYLQNPIRFDEKAALLHPIPLAKTPPAVHRVIHPGYTTDTKGLRAYDLHKKPLDRIIEDHSHLGQFFSLGEQQHPRLEPDGKGIYFTLQDDGREIDAGHVIGLNPQKKTNHEAAFRFLTDWIIKGEDFSAQNEKTIMANLMKTHALLGKGTIKNAGKLRKDFLVVFPEMSERTPQKLRQIVREKGGNIPHFNSALKKYEQGRLKQFTAEEREAFSLAAYIAPDHEKLPALLLNFVRHLQTREKEMIERGEVDYIALASFAHHQIGHIHPFGDGNGRLARALLNALLMRGGHDPVVFPDDNRYTDAVEREAAGERGAFERFLREEIIPWNQINAPRLVEIF